MMRTKICGYGLLILVLSFLTACVAGFTIGGEVSGLGGVTGGSLVLQNNGGDDLVITADGPFTFVTPVPKTGGVYAVTVKTQPDGLVCTVGNGSGTAAANVANVSVQCAAKTAATLQLLAGGLGGAGNLDGPGYLARFNSPRGVATDAAGNVYVADTYNHTIRKIGVAGDVSTIAGMPGVSGSADGVGSAARFYYPTGVAVDSGGNVYVADSINHTIRKITPAGIVTTLAGTAQSAGSADGVGAAARFDYPNGIAVDGAGNVYVADTDNNTIRMITPAGVVTTLAGTAGVAGLVDGPGAAASFRGPYAVAVDAAGAVYVADTLNSVIRKISPAGVVTTVITYGGGVSTPFGIAVDAAGNIVVTSNHSVERIGSAGTVTILAGAAWTSGSADGVGAAARLYNPRGVALDAAGNVFVADYGNHAIRKITPAGNVTTPAGSPRHFGSADGTGAAARFNQPAGITVDATGNAYVADYSNYTIRKINAAAEVTTLAGVPGVYGSSDGIGAAARFAAPVGVAQDSAGNIYVGEYANDLIRKISPAGVVTTFAGQAGVTGSADGTAAGASFNSPVGVAVDGADNVYVADFGNHTIRKVTPAGVVTTLAGLAGVVGSTDGAGAAARFNHPTGLAVDSLGNVYVADSFNHVIRMISPAGVVTTLAGLAGTAGSDDGTGAVARFNKPTAIAVDAAGNLYVTDAGNCTIRKISAGGSVTTVFGSAGKMGVQLAGSAGRSLGVAVTADKLFVVVEDAVLWMPKP